MGPHSGAAFGFHGLHLTTESVAAFGELLLRGDEHLVPREWIDLATTHHIDTLPTDNADFTCGYGYQFWMSRHGYHGHGAFGQQCVVAPSHDLVIAVTAQAETQDIFDALWEHLLPAMDHGPSAQDDELLADRLRHLSLPPIPGSPGPQHLVTAILDASAEGSALPDGTTVTVAPTDGGWLVRFEPLPNIEVGHGTWRESSPLGHPVVATGAWQNQLFVADLYVITTPHRVRVTINTGTGIATARWSTTPLTGPSLELHVRSPLMTRPDVA
ncbi:serine hydrolase domain-containing protein [Streptomyces acidiscabies]|uniref:hypothetical protein n=1 Tax=Streptomyces acidiscabies TaxID=42234 RepID=UPI000B09ADCA|nr:hypothetical protein [Streptomyces acidiscabies]